MQAQALYYGFVISSVCTLLALERVVARKNWTEEETLMAFALYRALPKKECDDKGADVQALATKLNRSANAVAMKIWNIAAHDPERVAQGKVGMSHGSKLDANIWAQFAERGDELLREGISLLDKTIGFDREDGSSLHYLTVELPEGEDYVVTATTRVNQRYFRNSLLENYRHRCCITGLAGDSLLVASHIKPWAVADPKTERTASSNGLLLNALHDRAFDQGLITIGTDNRVVVSRKVGHGEAEDGLLWRYNGQSIELPRLTRAHPRREFLEYHHDVIFQG